MRSFVKASEISKIDAEVISDLNISDFELMGRVSKEMSTALIERFPDSSQEFHILCGPGNNGGDGYWLARYLLESEYPVTVEAVMKPRSPSAERASKILPREIFTTRPSTKSILVDAIFGVQGRAGLPDEVRNILKKYSAWKNLKVSLDLPTPGFVADLSLCVAYPKMNFLDARVLETLGEIVYVGSDFPQKASSLMAIEASDFRLPARKRISHKGKYGRLGVVGGSAEMPGAAILAAEAGARMGAGYASLYFAKPSSSLNIKVKDASFLFHRKWKATDLKRESALVVGCGQRPPAIFKYSAQKIPMVVDASALSKATSSEVKAWKSHSGPMILTPHPGEAAALLKTSVKKIEADRMGAIQDLAALTGQSVYLKGSPGLLRFRDSKTIYVNLFANPAFATAGSGDILAGIMGGILAQGSLGFEESVISALAFQQSLSRILQIVEGSLSSDQLNLFNEAFQLLRRQN